MRKWLLCLLLFGLFLFGSGCAAVLVGAGVAGTVAYIKGDFESVEPYSIDKVFTAAQSALDELGIVRINEEKDALSAHITARDASDRKVSVKIKSLTDTSAKLSIRVSVFGDESKSRKIYLKIREHLSTKT